MLVIEFYKMCQIDGTEMVCRYDAVNNSIVVKWEFPIPNHPTVTHGSLSKTFTSYDTLSERLTLLKVEQVHQQIEQYLKEVML